MAEIDEIISKKAINDIFDADKGITQLDTATLKFIETVERLNSSLRENGISLKQVEGAQKQSDAAAKEAVRLAKEQEAAAKALDKQRSAALALMAKQEAKERELTAAINKEIKSEQDMIDKMNALIKVRKSLDTTTKSGIEEHKRLTKEINNYNNALKKSDATIGNHQRNVGNYKSALEGLDGAIGTLSPSLGAATAATRTFGAQLWALVKNPIVLTITVIVGALAALYAAFKSTDDGATKLEAIWASMGSVLDVLKRRIIDFADGVSLLFSGEFTAGLDKLSGSFSGMGSDLANTAKAAWDFVYAMDALEARQVSFISEEADIALQVAQLRALAKDKTKTDAEQEAALKRAIELERGLADKKKQFAKEEYDIAVANSAAKAGLTAQELDAFIRMSEESQTAATAAIPAYAKAWNLLNDEGIANLEKLYSESVGQETAFFNETRRLSGELSSFQADRNKQGVEDYKKALEEKLKAQEKYEDVWRSKVEAQRAILKEIQGDAGGVDSVDWLIKQMEDELAIEMEKSEATKKIWDEEYEARLKHEEDIRSAKQKTYDKSIEFINAGFDLYQSTIDKEISDVEKQRDFELKLAEGNRSKQAEINAKYDKIEADLKTKKAKAEKAQGIFNATINTAQAIVTALKEPYPYNLILMALSAALGAAQIAVIASQPIPQFYTGTQNAPSGLISLGERGRELVETKSGELFMANKPTLAAGLGGAKIYSNMETERLLKMKQANGRGIDISELATNQRTTNRLLKKLAVSHNGELIMLNDDKVIKSV